MDKGKVIEQGTHQSLIDDNAAYKKLLTNQIT